MENTKKTHLQNKSVHKILAHSYSVYLLFFLVSICLDVFFNFKVFNSSIAMPFGFILLIFATFLILWAQRASNSLKKENISKETFCNGPYCYTRSPTHWGLFLLMLGFGMITNAFFIILFTIISFIFSKLIFLNKMEKALAEKYGSPYLEYKKSVRL